MGKILVVDDNPVDVKMISDSLAQNGYSVLTAGNGKEGIDVALREKPDLIILDVVMPEMDGITMLKTLRTNPVGVEMPVIMLTSLADSTTISDALNNRVVRYVKKEELDLNLLVENVGIALQQQKSLPSTSK